MKKERKKKKKKTKWKKPNKQNDNEIVLWKLEKKNERLTTEKMVCAFV